MATHSSVLSRPAATGNLTKSWGNGGVTLGAVISRKASGVGLAGSTKLPSLLERTLEPGPRSVIRVCGIGCRSVVSTVPLIEVWIA